MIDAFDRNSSKLLITVRDTRAKLRIIGKFPLILSFQLSSHTLNDKANNLNINALKIYLPV